MPHTKRKGTVRTVTRPSLTSTPDQQTIEQFLTRHSTAQGFGVPADVTAIGDAVIQGIDTSLSPPTLCPPLQPAILNLTGGLLTPEVGESAPPPGQKVGFFIGASSKMEPEGAVAPQERPITSTALNAKVTLETIWEVLQCLDNAVRTSTGKIDTLFENVQTLNNAFTKMRDEVNEKINLLDVDSTKMKETTVKLIQDNTLIHNRLEYFENYNRRLNLRLLNFPKIAVYSPMDIFKRYLVENLKFTTDKIPPLNKIYYLPSKNLNEAQQILQSDLNVSELLETSLTSTTDRQTLLVSFVFQQDLELVRKLALRNLHNLFYGGKIWVFPRRY